MSEEKKEDDTQLSLPPVDVTTDSLIDALVNQSHLPAKVKGGIRGGGVVGEVVKLMAGGGFNILEIISAIQMIYELIQVVGPKAIEIYERIKKAFGK